MVVTLNPPTTTYGGNPKPTNILHNANNIWQGGNHKSTYYYRFITSEPQTIGSITSGIIIQYKGSITSGTLRNLNMVLQHQEPQN